MTTDQPPPPRKSRKEERRGNPTSGSFLPSFLLYRSPNLFHFCTVDRRYVKKGYCGAEREGREGRKAKAKASSNFLFIIRVFRLKMSLVRRRAGPVVRPFITHPSPPSPEKYDPSFGPLGRSEGSFGEEKSATRRSGDKKPSRSQAEGERDDRPL